MSGSSTTEIPAPFNATRIRGMVSKEELNQLTSVSTLASVIAIGANWLAIGCLIGGAIWIGTWWAAAIAVILVAGRQHSMLVLMHDASHRLLFRHRDANDVVSNLFLSFPLFVSTALYRRHHLAHHRYTNTDDDPDLLDTEIPATLTGFLASLAGDLIGLRSLRMLGSIDTFGATAIYKKKNDGVTGIGRERVLFAVFVAVVAAVLTFTGTWWAYGLYWFVPMWFVLPAILHIRAVSEHAGRTEAEYLGHARSVKPNLVEKALISPMNINLHLEHHLFPDVPFHRLGRVSRLIDRHPQLAGDVRRNQGYLFGRASVLGELYGRGEITGGQSR
ncbi:MAG: fatty acid desaturase family protein [Rhizobiaceae bacterium]|nr:fatty acid desaturase family protein [Rhizobiaceae bacterium]